MRDLTGENLTEAVLAGYENCKSPRFQEIMRSLVRHLHAFIREVELTEEGWFEGIRFLTKTVRYPTTTAKSSFCSPTRSGCRCW